MTGRATLRELDGLAHDLGLPPIYAQSWYERGLSLDAARADAAHRIRLRRALARTRMARAG